MDQQKKQPEQKVFSTAPDKDKDVKYIVRIVNTDLDGKKEINRAIKKIKGIGFSFSNAVLYLAKIDKKKKAGSLTAEEISRIETTIKNMPELVPRWMLNRRDDYETGETKHLLGADLDFSIEQDIRRMKKARSYKGIRHGLKLPVRGQRTKANFRRNKGKVMGVTKQKVAPAKKDSGGGKGK